LFKELDILNLKAVKKEFKNKKFDLIISNPPYIPSKEINTLDQNVRDFEPRLALDGGKDGLDYYRVIFKLLKNQKTKPAALFEIHENKSPELKKLFKDFDIKFIKDAFGKDRFVRIN
jgi:release factor glutamine methyltransferase